MISIMKKILITGGASGLGKAIAEHYANKNWLVLVVDIQEKEGKEFAADLKKEGSQAEYYHCDVGNIESIKSLYESVSKDHDHIDVLVNNAGVGSVGPLEKTTPEEWKRLIDIDLMSVIYGTQYFLPLLKKSEKGHVVSTASFAGVALMPGMMSYNVAKAGVIAFSETLQGELELDNIGVSVVCPAFFETNLVTTMSGASQKTKSFIDKQMKTSGITAADVAQNIDDAITHNKFMVITHKSSRWQYRMKRFFPNMVMRKKAQMYKKMVSRGMK